MHAKKRGILLAFLIVLFTILVLKWIFFGGEVSLDRSKSLSHNHYDIESIRNTPVIFIAGHHRLLLLLYQNNVV